MIFLSLGLAFVALCHCQHVDQKLVSMDPMYPSQLLHNHRANSPSQLAAIFAISGWILQASICMVQLTTRKQICVEGAPLIIFKSQGYKNVFLIKIN